MNKTVYTAITGNYDKLIPIPGKFCKGWKLKCFVDQINLKSDCWDLVEVARDGLSNLALARKVKILAHSYVGDADISIWIDGCMEVIAPLDNYANRFSGNGFVAIKHPKRKCAYQEMKACIKSKRADPEKIGLQEKEYLKIGFPQNYGLIETQILLRRKNERVTELNKLWWKLTIDFETWRDQITLPLALWKLQYFPRIISKNFMLRFFSQIQFHKGIYE